MKKGILVVSVLILLVALAACQKTRIIVISPNGGETFVAGKPIPFSWRWTGKFPPSEPAIYLYNVDLGKVIYGSLPDIHYEPGLEIQTGNFNALLYYRKVNGRVDGLPPDLISNGRYKIIISEYPADTNNPSFPSEPPRFDDSDDYFTIIIP